MLVTTEGIVLKQRKIANNRRMITVFTKDYGKISAGTSINEKSRNKSALAIRPFAYADYDIYKSRESFSINSAQVKKSFYSIGEDLDRFLVASRFIEFLDNILEEEKPKSKLFDMTLSFLESLTRTDGNYETLLLAFIVKTFRPQGVMPELKACVNCGKPASEIAGNKFTSGKAAEQTYMFSVSSGGIICEDCANIEKSEGNSLIYRPSFDIIKVLQYFINQPLEKFERIKLKPEVSAEMKNIIGAYTDYYMGVNVLKDETIWR